MRRITWAVLTICLLSAAMAQAEDWSKTYAITGKPDLHVETSDANIKVATWDQKTIDVKVTSKKWGFGQGGLQVEDHQNGDTVQIEVRFPRTMHFVSIGDRRVDIEVHMPREGSVNLHTGDGGIELQGVKGAMAIETGDGRVTFDGVEGALQAKTGDGRIEGKGRFDTLNLHTGDGRIEVDALKGSTIGSGWELRTGDGSVTLNLPDAFAANVEMHTSDGHITLDMPVTVEGRYDSNRIEGKMNGGGGSLRVQTGDGSIRIGRTMASL